MEIMQLAQQLGSFRHIERREGPASGYRVRTADHRGSALQTAWNHLIRARDPICAVHQSEAYLAYVSELGSAPELIVLESPETNQVTGIAPARHLKLDVSLKL